MKSKSMPLKQRIKLQAPDGFSLGLLVALGLIWSFMVRDQGVLSSLPTMPKNIILGFVIGLISATYYPIRFRPSLVRDQIFYFLGFTALIVIVNWPFVMTAITCDELYHAGMSSIAVRIIEKFSLSSWVGQTFGARPMTEVIALVSLLFVMFTWILSLGFIFLSKRASKYLSQRQIFFVFTWLIATLIGQACRTLPIRSEVHPPLRLLPLFLSQSIFGYDDISFRLPGIFVLALMATLLTSFILRKLSDDSIANSRLISLITGSLICLIPTVSHAATIVQPSIWCFAVWIGVFLLIDRYLTGGDDRFLIAAAATVGLGALMRQNAIVLWPIIGLVLILKRPAISTWVMALAPGIFVIPYLLVATSGSHAAASEASLGNVLRSLEGLRGPELILRSSTVPWVFLTVSLLVVAVWQRWWKKLPGFIVVLSILPAYVLYFMIRDYLWGLGRYQAEYIGPILVMFVVGAAIHLAPKFKKSFVFLLAVLGLYSVGVLRTLHYDVYYPEWPTKRTTTESIFPYREALGFLHRQAPDGRFVHVGGVPTYGDWMYYLRGFSYQEIDKHRQLQEKFEQQISGPAGADSLQKIASELGISYLVLQWGDRRELQHRTGWHHALDDLVKKKSAEPGSGVVLLGRFFGELEGAIDIYKL
jgi:hypothetical protein